MSNPLATREAAEQREHEWFAPLATFSDGAGERPDVEDHDPFRTAFVRDRDRVLHCGAFRRLKDKTQVFVIDEGDFYRTRLTHTLEVTQMARFLALALRLNDSLAEVLAQVHDIGHPPFGHEGERILNERSGVGFDHNRQALRIVDVLESPYPDRRGLNLTHAVRTSILKHGGQAGHGAEDHKGHRLEAQISDLADSIAYGHHDLEDALRAGIVVDDDLAELPIWAESAAAIDVVIAAAAGATSGKGAGDMPARSRRKAILSHILKTSLWDVVHTTAENLAGAQATDADDVARQGLRLVRHSKARAQRHKELARFLLDRFYRHPRVLRSAEVARDAITVIVDHYGSRPEEMPDRYRERVDSDGLGRSVCDYVAGMTDRYAMDEWRRLSARRGMVLMDATGDSAIETGSRVARLEQLLSYNFRDESLGATSLTHSSARTEEQTPNERLEFLGDSVLGLLVAQELFERFPDRAEGELSRIKSSVVSRHALRTVARRWGLGDLMTLGPGFRTSDDVPPSVVADAVEAVLGAVYLDGGLEHVRRIVRNEFAPLMDRAADRSRGTNFKSELQSHTQGELGLTPHYRILTEEGPDHSKTFTVAALLGDSELASATGRNKRQAEQRAARDALRRLLAAGEREPEFLNALRHAADPSRGGS